MNCQLERLAQYNGYWKGYADIVKTVIAAYPEHIKAMRAAQKLHREAQGVFGGAAREKTYDALTDTISTLSNIIEEIKAYQNTVDCAIRRTRIKHWCLIVGTVTGVLTVLIPVLSRFLP